MSDELKRKAIFDRAIDTEILFYVREMQQRAPVGVGAIEAYLTRQRQMVTDLTEIRDRLAYMVSQGRLKDEKEFEAGEWVHYYSITASGMDVLDGKVPY